MRKYLIGVIAGLVGVWPSRASPPRTSPAVSIGANVTPAKQDKKVRGGASVFFESTDTHAGNCAVPAGDCGVAVACRLPALGPDPDHLPDRPQVQSGQPAGLQPVALVGQVLRRRQGGLPGSIVGRGSRTSRPFSEAGPERGDHGVQRGALGRQPVAVPARRHPGRDHEADPQRGHSGQQPDGADPAGPGLGDRGLHTDDQQEGHREEEEQEDRQDTKTFYFDQVLEGQVDDHRDGHLPERSDAERHVRRSKVQAEEEVGIFCF